MSKDHFHLYELLLEGIQEDGSRLQQTVGGQVWSLARAGERVGIAMSTEGDSITPLFPGGLEGLSLREAARAAKSWNLREASLGLAAVNAWYNTEERLEKLGCYEPFDNYCTAGLDFSGKTVALVGHMKGPAELRSQAKEVFILERSPKAGDYPDPACEYILPKCDIVLITGSSIINKTLPRLLELCENAYTIVTGPSVPMCPELLSLGIDRLAGMVVNDREAMSEHALSCRGGSPYSFGTPFLLRRDG